MDLVTDTVWSQGYSYGLEKEKSESFSVTGLAKGPPKEGEVCEKLPVLSTLDEI